MFGINYNGLRKRQSYDELVNYIETDPNKIRYPDRTATFIEKSHYMKHLGGEDYIEMEQQQLRASKEKLKEAIIMDMATRGGTSSLLRDEIPTQSITIPQNVSSTQNVTSRKTVSPMQEVTTEIGRAHV